MKTKTSALGDNSLDAVLVRPQTPATAFAFGAGYLRYLASNVGADDDDTAFSQPLRYLRSVDPMTDAQSQARAPLDAGKAIPQNISLREAVIALRQAIQAS